MRLNTASLVLVATLTATTILTPSAFAADAKTTAKFADDTYKYLELFGDVFERVRKDYVEEVTDQQLLENAINGMLVALDPHSGYMPAKGFQEFREDTKGEYGGLGLEITMDGGFVKVISPIDETPAAKAGMQPGDFIVAVDGKTILGLSLTEAVEKMKGPVDTAVTITVRRAGVDPFDLKLTRAVVRVQQVRHRAEGDIGYIRITRFGEQTQGNLEFALRDLKQKIGPKLKGYVLDLRNNPGGLLDQSVSVADTFLDDGEIVSTRSRRADETQRFQAKAGDLTDGKPVVVLINDGSASASEIVAGALQDHHRAIVLGTKSFGKGSVQTVIPLGRSESAMRLTTARYYTPSGRSIQALGIVPDIEVQQAHVTKIAQQPSLRGKEADLKGALRNPDAPDPSKQPQAVPAAVPPGAPPGALPPGSAAPPAAPAPGEQKPAAPEVKNEGDRTTTAAKPEEAEDYQLARALDLLQGIALYQRAAAAPQQTTARTR